MSEKTLYFKKLDSLRTIAFLVVYSSHTFYHTLEMINVTEFIRPIFGSGEQGVRLFFVISGFLITYLLLIEYDFNYKINIKNFYIRRTLRIWPLYYLILLLGIYILPNISGVFNVAILSLISTIIISIISYEYFEKIFLNFKQKFSSVKTRI